MRTINFAVSILFLLGGLLFTLFMLTQGDVWNIGVAIGVVLVLNGVVRLVFAAGDEREPEIEEPYE